MKQSYKLTILLLLVTFGLALPDLALAGSTTTSSTAVGSTALSDVAKLVTGNIGTLIGLGIALLGLYTWLVQQSSWGIVMIIGGVAVTAFPGLFANLQAGFSSAFSGSSSSTSTVLNSNTTN